MKSESLKKRVGGRENKGNLGTDEMNNIGKLRDDLVNVEMIESLEEKHAGWKELG